MIHVSVLRGAAAFLVCATGAAAWADDADEPNDTPALAFAVGELGFVRTGRVLAVGDTDLYRVSLPWGASSFVLDVTWDRLAYSGTATLELTTADGAQVAAGAYAAASASLRLTTGPLPLGEYLVAVRHAGGGAISSYSVQGCESLTFDVSTAADTSAGVPVAIPLSIRGGVAPYSVVIDERFATPTGLAYDVAGSALSGTPGAAGRYDLVVTCRDSGSPASSVSVLTSLVVNARLDVRLGEFTAFVRDRSAARAIPAQGGTAPFAIEVTSGSLPAGVSLSDSGLAFAGSATAAGSTRFSFRTTDGVGVEAVASTTAVVCDPLGVVTLAEGRSACGAWLDAVKGSRVTVNVTASKFAAKRAFRALLLAPDGMTRIESKLRTGNGRAALSGITAPQSGRYHVIVESDEGPAMPLFVTAKITPATKGSGRLEQFAVGGETSIAFGAVAGSEVTLSARPDAASGLEIRVKSLLDPSGAAVAIGQHDVTRKGSAITLSTTLARSGTWTVVLAGSLGGPGRLTYSYRIETPPGASYSSDTE